MSDNLRELLQIPVSCVDEINALLLDPNNQAVNAFLEVVEKYGTPEEINRKAEEARQLPNLMAHLEDVAPAYVEDLRWLTEQRDKGAFSRWRSARSSISPSSSRRPGKPPRRAN